MMFDRMSLRLLSTLCTKTPQWHVLANALATEAVQSTCHQQRRFMGKFHNPGASRSRAAKRLPQAPIEGKQVFGACILERIPVIVAPMPQWEQEYYEWQFELHKKRYKTYSGVFAEVRTASEDKMEDDPDQHAAMIEAAENSNLQSPWRRLNQRIFMLCNPKGANEGTWEFPAAAHEKGETIRATAERALATALDMEGVRVHVLGNSPAAHHELDDRVTFFFRAQLISGEFKLQQGSKAPYSSYMLLAHDEIEPYVSDEKLLTLYKEMFIPLWPE